MSSKCLGIADSSFYICFLDDINKPEVLVDVFKNFQFYLTKRLELEIKKSSNYNIIDNNSSLIQLNFPYDISEVLRPFFGKSELDKGEHEVIAFSYLIYPKNKFFILILDEDGPRNFVLKNLSYLSSNLTGTVGFIGKCHCDYKIFQKVYAKSILVNIKNSKFRVVDIVLNSVLKNIERC